MTKAGKSPAFQFYAADFLADGPVMQMSYEERGVYVTLLAIAWNESGIPADLDHRSRLLRLSPRKLAKLWPAIEPCWRPASRNRLVNPRQERERKKQREWRKKSSKGGKVSARARAQGSPAKG